MEDTNSDFLHKDLWLKILYKFDNNPGCIAKSQKAISLPVAEESGIGQVSLSTCLDTVCISCPDILTENSSDYAVYSIDYSEEGDPSVGHGALSGLFKSDKSKPEDSDHVIGKIASNKALPFSKDRKNLQVQLKFISIRGSILKNDHQPEESPQDCNTVVASHNDSVKTTNSDEAHRFSSPIIDDDDEGTSSQFTDAQRQLVIDDDDDIEVVITRQQQQQQPSSPPTPRDSPQINSHEDNEPPATPSPTASTKNIAPASSVLQELSTNTEDKPQGTADKDKKRKRPNNDNGSESGSNKKPTKNQILYAKRQEQRRPDENKECANCGTNDTCTWRKVFIKDQVHFLCNPCGLFYYTHQVMRPASYFNRSAIENRYFANLQKNDRQRKSKGKNARRYNRSTASSPAVSTTATTSAPQIMAQTTTAASNHNHTIPASSPMHRSKSSQADTNRHRPKNNHTWNYHDIIHVPASSPLRKAKSMAAPSTTNPFLDPFDQEQDNQFNYYYDDDDDKENRDPREDPDIEALFSTGAGGSQHNNDEPPSLTHNPTSDLNSSDQNQFPKSSPSRRIISPNKINSSPSKWISKFLNARDEDLTKTFLDSSPSKSSANKKANYDEMYSELGIDVLDSDPVTSMVGNSSIPSSPPTFFYLYDDDRDHHPKKPTTSRQSTN